MTTASFKRIARLLSPFFSIRGTNAGDASDWPPLPTAGFITGRPAQKDDVVKRDAVFVLDIEGVVVGKPLPISIPQYALLRESGERVILVQAEEVNGIRLFGVRNLDGEEVAAMDTDLELLGTQRPRE